jgi:mycothiol synthase
MKIFAASALTEEQRQRALALLFPHQAPAIRAEFPIALHDSLFVAALDQDAPPAGALLVECMPGGSANLWGPRVGPGARRQTVEDMLLGRGQGRLAERQSRIIQAFRSSGEDPSALVRFGMRRITSVWSMQSDERALPRRDPADALLQFDDQGAGVSSAFRQALMASFEGSLDCPELNGLRSADEIIEGHLGSAADLSRWWLASRRGEPAGVLILAQGEDGLELSYVGVPPAFRRQRIGGSLLDFCLRQTENPPVKFVSLLVDERNRPAIDLYVSRGFRKVGSRDVYLQVLQLR